MTPITTLELTLPAVPASVRKARDAVAEAVAPVTAGERMTDDVRLCVSEAVSNVVRHAYGTKRGDVEVVVEQDDDEVCVVVRDAGKGMTKAHREGRMGGFGLKIIAKLAANYRITTAPNAGVEMKMVFPVAAAGESGDSRGRTSEASIACS